MTPGDLARLHAAAMTVPRPWSAQEFAALLTTPGVFLTGGPLAFALGRAVADEAELLTLATDPAHRRRGLGRAALTAFETEARVRGAARAYLEVAETNAPAIALYRAAGYGETGRRPAYYRVADQPAVAALTLSKPL